MSKLLHKILSKLNLSAKDRADLVKEITPIKRRILYEGDPVPKELYDAENDSFKHIKEYEGCEYPYILIGHPYDYIPVQVIVKNGILECAMCDWKMSMFNGGYISVKNGIIYLTQILSE